MEKIRILLADDHNVLRQGVAQMLEMQADMTVVAQAQNGQEAIQLARQHRPARLTGVKPREQRLRVQRAAEPLLHIDKADRSAPIQAPHQRDLAQAQRALAVVPHGKPLTAGVCRAHVY